MWDFQGKQLANLGTLYDQSYPGYSNIEFSPDGQRLVTISSDKTARLWDFQGKQLANLGTLYNPGYSNIEFSPDGQRLVTISSDKTARLWDFQGKQLANLGTLYNPGYSNIEFSPKGQRLVTYSSDKTARLWDFQGNQLHIFGNLKDISNIEFSPDGQRLVIVSASSQVILQAIDKVTGNQDTQPFSLVSFGDVSAFQNRLINWLVTFSSIGGSLVVLVLPVGYIIARSRVERNTKPPDFLSDSSPEAPTPTAASALTQKLDDEVQVAQAVHLEPSRDTETVLSPFTETNEYFPVTRRQMKQSWRYLRRLVRNGPPVELDLEATVNQMSCQGMLLQPVLRPRRVNRNELLLLLDQDGSMAPFHALSERLADTAIQGGRLANANIYYFHNCPSNYLYQDPYHLVAEPVSEVLSGLHFEYTGVLIFSDAGAARGAFSEERLSLTAEFLDRLRQQVRYMAWLNPMPRERWLGTTAGAIAQLVPMFELSRQGLLQAIDVLRGKPTHQKV